MRIVTSGPLLSIHTFCSIQWFCLASWEGIDKTLPADMGFRCPHLPGYVLARNV